MSIVSQRVENDKMQAVSDLLDSLSQLVTKAVDKGCAAHEMERRVHSHLMTP